MKGSLKDYCILYVTFSNIEEAEGIIKLLLEQKLIACANVFKSITSHYIWENELKSSSEVITILKSKKSKIEKINTIIKKHHSYNCPCIITFSVENINPEYLNWLDKNLSSNI